jgi:hypothetical protein
MIRKRQVFATKWLSKITFIQLKFWNRKVIFVDRWCQKTLILTCLASKNSYPQKLIKKLLKSAGGSHISCISGMLEMSRETPETCSVKRCRRSVEKCKIYHISCLSSPSLHPNTNEKL